VQPAGLQHRLQKLHARGVELQEGQHERTRAYTSRALSLNAQDSVDDTVDVAVVGGGPAGLAAALTLREAGISVAVLEAGPEPGGLVRSIRTGGYTFDCSGHVLHLAHARTRHLVMRVTSPEDWIEHERRSFVWIRDRLVPYPFQLHLAHAPPDVRDECVAGLPDGAATRMPAAAPFDRWIDATLGPGIGRHFMVPYNEKVATVPVAELTCEWLGRFVPTPSLADIRAGAATARIADGGYNRRFLYPRHGGIDRLWRALAAHAGPIAVDARVVAIDTSRRTVRVATGERVGYRAGVIVSAAVDATAAMIEPTLPHLAAAARLRASAVTCVNLGVRAVAPAFRDAHWIYLPEPRFRAYRVGFYDRFAPGMAPPGRHGLYVEIAHRPDATERELVGAAIADMVLLGVIAGPADVEVVVPVRIPTAYVIHDAACASARATLHAELSARQVHMVGRYGRWEYGSIEDALRQGIEAAEALAAGSPIA
jgi:protoporphyrinogen oxidase